MTIIKLQKVVKNPLYDYYEPEGEPEKFSTYELELGSGEVSAVWVKWPGKPRVWLATYPVSSFHFYVEIPEDENEV